MNQAEVVEVLDKISALADMLPRIRVSLNVDARLTISALCAEMKEALPRKVEALQQARARTLEYLAQKDSDQLYGANRLENIDRELAELT